MVKDGWMDPLFVFDTLSYPDGVYFIKLGASDLNSNPPGSELKSEKTSAPLVIDNSLPVVKNFTAARDAGSLEVAFQVEDSFSSIQEVEYLIRPGEWRVVFPADGVCDSRLENFKFRALLPSNVENLVTVRVTDRHQNIGVYRQAF